MGECASSKMVYMVEMCVHTFETPAVCSTRKGDRMRKPQRTGNGSRCATIQVGDAERQQASESKRLGPENTSSNKKINRCNGVHVTDRLL